jgi:BolA protein
MSLQDQIEKKIRDTFSPTHLELHNESHKHRAALGSESHFKLVVVSDAFKGVKFLERHRKINKLLADEFNQGVHALSIHAVTPDEYKGAPSSPPCSS